jgi:hypothetical protein
MSSERNGRKTKGTALYLTRGEGIKRRMRGWKKLRWLRRCKRRRFIRIGGLKVEGKGVKAAVVGLVLLFLGLSSLISFHF